MSIQDAWGEEALSITEKQKPFYKVAKEDEKARHKWLRQVKDALVEQSKGRTRKQRENLMYYRGLPDRLRSRQRYFDKEKRFNKVRRFVVNHLFDLTETKVSQMTRIKPAVEVVPTNDEWADRGAAKAVGFLIKHLWDLNNVDFLIQNMHRYARIFGESYTFIDWDPSKGDLHPDYVEARDAGLPALPLPNGDVVDIEGGEEVKTGDVCYELEVPWRVLLQRAQCYDKSEYLFRVKVEKTDELKEKYPEKQKKIKATDNLKLFDIDDLVDRFVEHHTITYEFWHKSVDKLDKGFYAKFTDECLLEEGDHKFTHGKFPCIRHTDLDVPDVLNGISKYEMIIPLQDMHNNVSSLIAKNIYLMAHAKWMMPRGACKIDQLGNDNTIVQYQGPVAPSMAQVMPNPPETYAFRQEIKQEMQTIYGSHGISRGEIPKGITAASALQFLNELESERATTDISKHSFLIRDLAKMTVAVAGDKYDTEDGRLVRIVGENNKYSIREFDAANLNKNYDIRFDVSTGLPETKAAKLQRVLEAMQRNPEMLQPERWEELLDLGNTEKMVSLMTLAVQSADSENEDILAGRDIAPPERYEDHIQHWDSHVKKLQSRQVKEDATPENRKALEDHLYMTEKLMIDKAKFSPLFEAKLATLPLFPIFYHGPLEAPRSKEHQEAMVQGQANKGEAVTGQIPGTDVAEQDTKEA